MRDKLELYLKDKELTWAEATIDSARGTLNGILPHLNGDAMQLWEALKQQKPYTRVTTWTRVCNFWDFILGGRGENPYRQFRLKNARLFKNTYTRQLHSQGIEQAKEKIDSISNPAIRKKALELLLSGMRWSESFTLEGEWVTGKGGLRRKVYLPEIEGPLYKGSYRNFLRHLEAVGLKPHTLRKIYLTECVRSGANIFDLLELAGWKQLETAKSYVGSSDERLRALAQRVRDKSERRGTANPRSK